MECKKDELEKMETKELIELSKNIMEETILMIRNVSFILLPKNNHNDESQEFYVKILIELTDIIHNIPSYVRHENREGMITELKCMLNFLEEKVFVNSMLIKELNAWNTISIFMEKQLII